VTHPAELVERIRELRILGGRTEEIAKACGVSTKFVQRAARDLPQPRRRTAIPPETLATLREMYFVGVDVKTIGTVLGVSWHSIARHVAGMPRRNVRATEPQIESMRAMRRLGRTVARIARDVGFSNTTVQRYVRDVRPTLEAEKAS
jgi:DNA invertase Pin-like site-specific DNA recombinase